MVKPSKVLTAEAFMSNSKAAKTQRSKVAAPPEQQPATPIESNKNSQTQITHQSKSNINSSQRELSDFRNIYHDNENYSKPGAVD
jgi:hypothetical protein